MRTKFCVNPKYLFHMIIIISVIFFYCADLKASTPIQTMKKSTVRILCMKGNSGGTGSGFITGKGKYVITNWHVVADTETGSKTSVLISGQEGATNAKVIWHSEEKDLAILKLEKKTRNPSVKFAESKRVKDADTVYALGFPGAGDNPDVVGEESGTTVKISKGIISAFVSSDLGVKLYQVDSAINPGNSGGPLFNEYGQVIGINTSKSLALVMAFKRNAAGKIEQKPVRVTQGEGIGWSVMIDEILPELKKLGISSKNAGITDSMARLWHSNPGSFWGIVLACLLSSSSLLLLFTKKGRVIIKDAVSVRLIPNKSSEIKENEKAILKGLEGEFKDCTIELGNEPLIMGRDPGVCHLVFTTSDISKRHCILHFDETTKLFELEDAWSQNGIFLESGEQVKSGQSVLLKSGGGFYLSDKSKFFRVIL